MGSKGSTTPLPEDVKHMNRRWPGSARFCRKWNSEFGFPCKLVVGQCEELERRIEMKIEGLDWKARGKLEMELEAAMLWTIVAKRRLEVDRRWSAQKELSVMHVKVGLDEECRPIAGAVAQRDRDKLEREERGKWQREREDEKGSAVFDIGNESSGTQGSKGHSSNKGKKGGGEQKKPFLCFRCGGEGHRARCCEAPRSRKVQPQQDKKRVQSE